MECNRNTILHVECKNLMGGLTTAVFKKVIGNMQHDSIVSLLFTSDMNGFFSKEDAFAVFAQNDLGLGLHDVCFLVLEPNKNPYWLSIQKDSVTLEPTESTKFLMVLVATGAVESNRS